MQNLTRLPCLYLHRVFDLKGSMYERNTKNLITKLNKCKQTALKEHEFLWMTNVDKKVNFNYVNLLLVSRL